MLLRLGIDIACRAAHQVSLADEQGDSSGPVAAFAPHRRIWSVCGACFLKAPIRPTSSS
jgi:hypothetical protein